MNSEIRNILEMVKRNEIMEDVALNLVLDLKKNGMLIQEDNAVAIRKKDAELIRNNASDVEHLEDPLTPGAISGKAGGNPAEDLESVESYLAGKLANVLELADSGEVNKDQHFMDMGIDSISLVELVKSIEAELKIELYPTLLFEHSNIRSLGRYFFENFVDAFLIHGSPNSAANKHNATTQEPLPKQIDLNHGQHRNESVAVQEEPDDSSSQKLNNDAANPFNSTRSGAVEPFRPQSNTHGHVPSAAHDIAIIGLGGRYPKSNTLEEFWENLKNGVDCITEIPQDRWDIKCFFDENRDVPGKTYSKWGGFIDNVACFDAMFFNVSPKEAVNLDPQERLFLQTAWETIEDAGYTRRSLHETTQGMVGVYAGVTSLEYHLCAAQESLHGNHIPIGGTLASVANRVSYFCNFNGPSISVDSMCSSSLSAIQLAVDGLISGSCQVALAGGVNALLHPLKYTTLSERHFISEKGRCESFGEGGSGYIPAEAVGCILLKPLQKAIDDNDNIYGVIKGSAINHGGKTNGFTVPNPYAQQQVIEQALQKAALKSTSISYIEAHGTGTSLGDPIEIAGLTSAFQKDTDKKQFCKIGSVKSNMGHAESAAGIAGLTKILLQMKHRMIAPSLHSQTLNSKISFEKTPFVVPQTLIPWAPAKGNNGTRALRRAGLSSFGAGGSNAHMIIEEYPEQPQESQEANSPVLIVLSAKKRDRLKKYAADLARHLESDSNGQRLVDIAYTLQVGRESMNQRLAFVATNKSDAAEVLNIFAQSSTNGDAKNMNGIIYSEISKDNEIVTLLSGDQELDNLVKNWFSRGQLNKVGELWVRGVDIDWPGHWNAKSCRRVSLPTYPFEAEYHWFEKSEAAVQAEVNLPSVQTDGVLYGQYKWLPERHTSEDHEGNGSRHLDHILLASKDTAILNALKRAFPDSHIHSLDTVSLNDYKKIEGSLIDAFSVIKSSVRAKSPITFLLLVPFNNGKLRESTISGVLKTASLENSNFNFKVVYLPKVKGMLKKIVEICAAESCISNFAEVMYDRSLETRFVKSLAIEDQKSEGKVSLTSPYGVYWIIGGLGGIGLKMAKQLFASDPTANIVLSGRTEPDDSVTRKIERLKRVCQHVEYVQCDVSKPASVKNAVSYITRQYNMITGIYHCAGCIRDSKIAFKTVEQIRQVIAPKIQGTIALDEGTKHLPLEYFITFSSISSVIGNIGQADYAAANSFQNYYAEHRNALCRENKRSGRSLSIAWPIWQNGGMRVDEKILTEIYDRTGMFPMDDNMAEKCLKRAFSTEADSVYIFTGNSAKLKKKFFVDGEIISDKSEETHDPPKVVDDIGHIENVLIEKMVSLLGIDKAKVAPDDEIFDYGFDSITLLEFSNYVSKSFNIEPDPEKYFEHTSIQAIAKYIVDYKTKGQSISG